MKRHHALYIDRFWNGKGSSIPINLRVVFVKPWHSKDYLSLSKVQYHKINIFSGMGKLKFNGGFPSDGTFGVGSAIHIICKDWVWKSLRREVGLGEKPEVNEVFSSTTIDNGGGFNDLCISS